MPAQAQKQITTAANDHILSREQLDSLDRVSVKLMCADGVLSAIFCSFSDDAEPRMSGPHLHEALYALMDLIRDARTAVNSI